MKCPRCGIQNQPEQETCSVCDFRFSSLPGTVDENRVESIPTATGEPDAVEVEPFEHAVVPYQSPVEAELTSSGRSSRVPVVIAIAVAILVVIGTVVAVVLSSILPRVEGLPFRTPVSANPTETGAALAIEPAALLDLSSKAMADVHSLHYQSEVGFYGVDASTPVVIGTSVLSMTLNGDVVLPGSYTMNTSDAQLGQFIVISDTTWIRSNGNASWLQRPTTDVGLGPVNPLAVAAYLQYYRQGTPQYIGSETRQNVLVHHIRFDVDTENMGMDSPERSVQNLMFRSRITADTWIRDTDRLLDSIALAVDTGDGKGVILRTSLSGYNAQVDIKPPQGASPIPSPSP